MYLKIKLTFMFALLLIVSTACRDNNNNATATPDISDGGPNQSDGSDDNGANQADNGVNAAEDNGDGQSVADPAEDGEEVELVARPAGYAPTEFVSLGDPLIVSLLGETPYEVGGSWQHTISEGEWFSQIARCYGVQYGTLLAANPNLINPDFLQPGDVLNVNSLGEVGPIIGSPCVYRPSVDADDSWQSLAADFNVSITELQGLNPGPLQIGRRLLIPATTSAATAQPLASLDLWFMLDGGLAKWSANTIELTAIQIPLSRILDIETNSSGDWILARIAHEDVEDIVLIDTKSLQMKTLETGVANSDGNYFLPSMSISENGEYGAYIIRDENGERLTTFATSNPENAIFQMIDQASADEMIIFPIVQLKDYPLGDVARVAVSTNAGLYLVDYATGGIDRLLEIDLENGNDANFYALETMSPDGRYFLAQGYFFEASIYFLIDMHSGARLPLPEASSYINRAAAAWNFDGEVTTLLRNDDLEALGLEETIYEVVGNEDGFELTEISQRSILMGETAIVDFGARVSLSPAAAAFFPSFVTNVNRPGIWITFEGVGEMRMPLSETADLGQVLWAPTGEGALVWIDGGPLYSGDLVYVSAARNFGLSLVSILGSNIDDFHWTTP